MDNQKKASGSPPLTPYDPDRTSVITNRTDLIQALCDAAQLEHGLCCAYLYAAFSIKRRVDEGVPPHRLPDLRTWESTLLLIARQEMDHLGTVANLLTAVGGMPYMQNPSFPIATDRYGQLPALPLEKFSQDTLKRFLQFEQPEWAHLADIIQNQLEKAKSHLQGLDIVCQLICSETEWLAGDVWAPEGGTMVLKCRVRDDSGLTISYDHPEDFGQEMWTRWQTPHAPQGQEFQTARGSVVNTYIEIPTYTGAELKWVWRFFYETFRTFDEDDATAQGIELMLGGPGTNAIRDALDKLQSVTIHPDTGLRSIQPKYSTLGGFYRQIRKGFLRLCHNPTGDTIFTGFQTANPDIGVNDRNVHDMNLAKVSDLDSALGAINEIIETGEGYYNKRVASHYVRLNAVLVDLAKLAQEPESFDPARETVGNPITGVTRNPKPACTLLQNPGAKAVGEIFDAIYAITLQMVTRFFTFPDDKVLEGMAFGPLMTMAIRPLAEILTELPVADNSDQKAGPPFQSPTRDLLHPHRLAAWSVFAERLEQIAKTCEKTAPILSRDPKNPQHKDADLTDRLMFISRNVAFIAQRLKTAVAEAKAGKSAPPSTATGK